MMSAMKFYIPKTIFFSIFFSILDCESGMKFIIFHCGASSSSRGLTMHLLRWSTSEKVSFHGYPLQQNQSRHQHTGFHWSFFWTSFHKKWRLLCFAKKHYERETNIEGKCSKVDTLLNVSPFHFFPPHIFHNVLCAIWRCKICCDPSPLWTQGGVAFWSGTFSNAFFKGTCFLIQRNVWVPSVGKLRIMTNVVIILLVYSLIRNLRGMAEQGERKHNGAIRSHSLMI